MNVKLKKIFDIIRNKDVQPDDTPTYYYLKDEMLERGNAVVNEKNNVYIEEVFEYNSRAMKARRKLYKIDEARKGYMRVNPIVFLGMFAVLKALEIQWNDSYLGKFTIFIYVATYMFTLFKKKFNIYANVISTAALLCVNLRFIWMLILNIILCYLYDRAEKPIKDEFGYPNFPRVDLTIRFTKGGEKIILAREME